MSRIQGKYDVGAGENEAEFIMLQSRSAYAKDFVICQRQLFTFLSRTTLKPSTLRVYFYYLSKCEFGAFAHPIPQRVIGECCSMTQPQVSMAISDLVKHGLLVLEPIIYDDGSISTKNLVQFPSHLIKRGIKKN